MVARKGRFSRYLTSGFIGGLHGVAELLPVSSSAHVWSLARRFGYQPQAFFPAQKKAFEVALHAATVVPVALRVRRSFKAQRSGRSHRFLFLYFISAFPAVVVGGVAGDAIEKRFSSSRAKALFLLIGSILFGASEYAARQKRTVNQERELLSGQDLLLCGSAQACALFPGISRLGAVVAVLRLRGYSSESAYDLAHLIGLPVGCAAVGYKAASFFSQPPQSYDQKDFSPSYLSASVSSALCAAIFFPHMKRLSRRYPGSILSYRLLFALEQLTSERAVRPSEL